MLGFPMAHTLSVVSRVRLKTFSMFGTLHGVCQWKEDLVSIFHFLFSFSFHFFFVCATDYVMRLPTRQRKERVKEGGKGIYQLEGTCVKCDY